MNNTADTHESQGIDDLELVQELLPWYALGTLDGAELAFMKQWLALHMAEHPDISTELAWLRSSASHLQAEASAQAQQAMASGPGDLGLAAVMQRIAQERAPEASTQVHPTTEAQKNSTRPWLAQLGDRIKTLLNDTLGMRSPAGAFAVFALLLVQAGVIGSLLLQKPAEQQALSGAPGVTAPANAVLLTVAFSPSASEQAIRQTLSRANAQIVAGPSALGLYMLSVPAGQADQATHQLQEAKGIVESVQR